MESKIKKAFLKLNPNAASGLWNFWQVENESKTNKTLKVGNALFVYEYQSGINHDYTIKI